MALRRDVYELLFLYRGAHPSEALDPFPVEEDGVTPRLPRDRRDNRWITEDPVGGRYLVFRSQLPPHLTAAYDIAISDGLLEQELLEPNQQLELYRRTAACDVSHAAPTEERHWQLYPNWTDWLVWITPKGRGALAAHETPCELMPDLGTAKAAAGNDFREPLDWATRKLKGDERRVVELAAEGGGRVGMANLALALEWQSPYDDKLGSLVKRVNAKLRKAMPWQLKRHDNCACLSPMPGGRK